MAGENVASPSTHQQAAPSAASSQPLPAASPTAANTNIQQASSGVPPTAVNLSQPQNFASNQQALNQLTFSQQQPKPGTVRSLHTQYVQNVQNPTQQQQPPSPAMGVQSPPQSVASFVLAMAEYWRYQDRLASGQLLTKRPRAELDDVLLHGSAGYGRGDLRFDERDARLLDYGLDYGKAGAAYGSVGLSGVDIAGLGDGTILTGSLRVPSLGLSGLEDPRLSGVDSGLLKGASVGLNGARSDILSRQDVPGGRPGLRSLPSDASPTLFVEGLPMDCTRREAAHIFRPFRGFKEVRVVQKESKRAGGDMFILCFVEFEDAYSATKAYEALRGYKLDENDRDSEPLRLQFARVGAPRGGGRDDHRGGRDRSDYSRRH